MKYITAKYLVKTLSRNLVFLMLDYDGTLVPIRPIPSRATLPPKTKKILLSAAESHQVILSIISGRSLHKINQMVGIEGIIYSGNHGLEIKTPYFKFRSPVPARMRKAIQHIAHKMNSVFYTTEGVIVEDKGLTLGIHYRLADPSKVSLIKKITGRIVSKEVQKRLVEVHSGKKVMEIRPCVAWDKGKAVLWLIKKYKEQYPRKKFVPVYIGDDRTDEAAFSVLKNKGITVRIGFKRSSKAKYVFKNVSQVLEFLKMLSKRKKRNEHKCQ